MLTFKLNVRILFYAIFRKSLPYGRHPCQFFLQIGSPCQHNEHDDNVRSLSFCHAFIPLGPYAVARNTSMIVGLINHYNFCQHPSTLLSYLGYVLGGQPSQDFFTISMPNCGVLKSGLPVKKGVASVT